MTPVADIEHALAVVAYIVLRHGEAYAPLLDRLEAEVEEARRRTSHRERAQRILAGFKPTEVRRVMA